MSMFQILAQAISTKFFLLFILNSNLTRRTVFNAPFDSPTLTSSLGFVSQVYSVWYET